jgi:polyhydroxyalkanoate synthase subunit PhaC
VPQGARRFAADVITAAPSPANYLGTNPAALRKAAETGGISLIRGAQNVLRDLARGGMPSTGSWRGCRRTSWP